MRRIVLILLFFVLVVALIVPAQAQSASIHLVLGNPTAATGDTTNPNNYLIIRPQYALAYYNDDGIPRWVSWHLELHDLGPAPISYTHLDVYKRQVQVVNSPRCRS